MTQKLQWICPRQFVCTELWGASNDVFGQVKPKKSMGSQLGDIVKLISAIIILVIILYFASHLEVGIEKYHGASQFQT
jgi:hypothetical protein